MTNRAPLRRLLRRLFRLHNPLLAWRLNSLQAVFDNQTLTNHAARGISTPSPLLNVAIAARRRPPITVKGAVLN